jgi:hypothetical protein
VLDGYFLDAGLEFEKFETKRKTKTNVRRREYEAISMCFDGGSGGLYGGVRVRFGH